MIVELAFVIPVFNQLQYTAQCLDSLMRSGVAAGSLVVVDNGSKDGTGEFLARQAHLRVLSNAANLGCAAAWNQGVEAAQSEWTIVLNNDVVVPPGFREGLLDFAREARCDIVSPALGEGELDYDLEAFAEDFVRRMKWARRWGTAFGVCFMVHRRVFEAIGLFDTLLGQAGYEDEDFFRRARRAGFRLAVTGRAYLHHFGSVTQKSVKSELGMAQSSRLGNRDYFRKKHGLNWLRRRLDRLQSKIRTAFWRLNEQRRGGGLTLHLRRTGGVWRPG
jgi:N-acetylglucosaminyl-diphospho-decaprenol L-rhamnosyltransferase